MFIVHVHCSLFMFIVHCSHGATLIFDDLFSIITWLLTNTLQWLIKSKSVSVRERITEFLCRWHLTFGCLASGWVEGEADRGCHLWD